MWSNMVAERTACLSLEPKPISEWILLKLILLFSPSRISIPSHSLSPAMHYNNSFNDLVDFLVLISSQPQPKHSQRIQNRFEWWKSHLEMDFRMNPRSFHSNLNLISFKASWQSNSHPSKSEALSHQSGFVPLPINIISSSKNVCACWKNYPFDHVIQGTTNGINSSTDLSSSNGQSYSRCGYTHLELLDS